LSSNDETQAEDPTSPLPVAAPHGVFATTHWSVVLAAKGKDSSRSVEALENLCRAYWYPLYCYARRSGQAPADAEDLTQGFFARLVEKDYLRSATSKKGRFRTFLLVAFRRYMANQWEHAHAKKRGGFVRPVAIDAETAERRLAREPADQLSPDVLFDRQWARTLLERTMKGLQEEYASTGRARLFEHLRDCLSRDEAALSYAEIAAELKLTEAAVKMAVHRLRSRYREILRAEIAQTVSTAEEIEEEIQHLFSSFGS